MFIKNYRSNDTQLRPPFILFEDHLRKTWASIQAVLNWGPRITLASKQLDRYPRKDIINYPKVCLRESPLHTPDIDTIYPSTAYQHCSWLAMKFPRFQFIKNKHLWRFPKVVSKHFSTVEYAYRHCKNTNYSNYNKGKAIFFCIFAKKSLSLQLIRLSLTSKTAKKQ